MTMAFICMPNTEMLVMKEYAYLLMVRSRWFSAINWAVVDMKVLFEEKEKRVAKHFFAWRPEKCCHVVFVTLYIMYKGRQNICRHAFICS